MEIRPDEDRPPREEMNKMPDEATEGFIRQSVPEIPEQKQVIVCP